MKDELRSVGTGEASAGSRRTWSADAVSSAVLSTVAAPAKAEASVAKAEAKQVRTSENSHFSRILAFGPFLRWKPLPCNQFPLKQTGGFLGFPEKFSGGGIWGPPLRKSGKAHFSGQFIFLPSFRSRQPARRLVRRSFNEGGSRCGEGGSVAAIWRKARPGSA
jgi:hypothetical protein